MAELLIAQQGIDLEAQIARAFEQLPREVVALFVWLPKPRKLFEALRGPIVAIDGDEVDVRDGFEIELLPVRYSSPTMRWLLGQLGLLETRK